MSATDFDTDVDQALLISYDWDPPCEGCNQSAELAIYCRCGCVLLACTPCRDHDYRSLMLRPRPRFRHYDCGTAIPWLHWEDVVVREVPL